MMKLGNFAKGLQHIGLPTNHMDTTIAFYEGLGFTKKYETLNEKAGERVVFLELKGLAQEQGYEIVSNGIEALPFWEKGVRFFLILGPNQERIEFNEIL